MRLLTLGFVIWCGVGTLSAKIGLAQMEEASKERIETHLKHIVGERNPRMSDKHLAEVSHYIQETL